MSERYIPKVGDKFTVSALDDRGLSCVKGNPHGQEFVSVPPLVFKKDLETACGLVMTPSFYEFKKVTTVAPKGEVDATLVERGRTYGPYKFQATISQSLKDVMRKTPGFSRMSPYQQESLDMIANKLGRILNGDPNYVDSWLDIAGYAQLVVDQLNGKST